MGVILSGKPNPDYQNSASLSFAVEMTCQVSDVDVSSRSMRRLSLPHRLLASLSTRSSFALSTDIISALLVN
jgi:uncharacterized membrane protein